MSQPGSTCLDSSRQPPISTSLNSSRLLSTRLNLLRLASPPLSKYIVGWSTVSPDLTFLIYTISVVRALLRGKALRFQAARSSPTNWPKWERSGQTILCCQAGVLRVPQSLHRVSTHHEVLSECLKGSPVSRVPRVSRVSRVTRAPTSLLASTHRHLRPLVSTYLNFPRLYLTRRPPCRSMPQKFTHSKIRTNIVSPLSRQNA